ncbi:hypothetical protein QYS62_008682 [Fusarium acuminatum]|uniref:C2H2-type domain-containing protein n=1 Tax=Fusarium acuminatum TaxID=5515 RepID=A0ABZ2X378_9HYPO
MHGEEFATSALYFQHLQESDGHGAVKARDDSIDTESDFSLSPSGQQSTEDDVFGSITFDENICHEPCCRHYGADYKRISEYIRHADTGIHRLAVTINKYIVSSIPIGPALYAEQKAVRELRCISPHCLMFDQIFKTARSFYKHLSEGSHRDGWSVDLGNADLDYNSDKDILPGIEFSAGGRKGRCVNDKCPRYGMNFDSYGDMKQHARSFGHTLTEEDLESTEAEESGEEIWKKSDMSGIEVTECESLWRCIKEGCKGYNMIMSHLGNVRSHFNSDAHLMAAYELSSSDESLEQLEGMTYSKDERSWTCVKGGCKKFGNAMQQIGNARKHANTDAHLLADERVSAPGNLPEQEEMEGMGFSHEKHAWSCVRHTCKGRGKFFASVGFARLHANCASHIKAGEDMVMTEPDVYEFSIPKSTTMRTPAAQLLTPVDMDTSNIYVSPESPSSGRGTNRYNTGSTPRMATSARAPKTIRLRRSPATKSQIEKRQFELENKNHDLEERVSKLEEQMGQLLAVQSPQASRSAHSEVPSPRSPLPPPAFSQASSPLTSVSQSPVSSASVIYTLSRFVRSPFRPRIPVGGTGEPSTFRRLPARPQVSMNDEEEEL